MTEELKLSEVHELLITKYFPRQDSIVVEVMDVIARTDFRKRFVNSLNRGFSGFRLFKSPFLIGLCIEEQRRIQDRLFEKLKQAKIGEVAFPHIYRDEINITPWWNKLKENYTFSEKYKNFVSIPEEDEDVSS